MITTQEQNICILTVIKDEHLYLDEWIKYHLDIGVSCIFILEDIGSKSHSEITVKYGNKVILLPVLAILPEQLKQSVNSKRIKSISGSQMTYLKAGLNYIKKYFKFDWCFVIDNDEFITLTNNTLNEVLSLYSNYDALILSWKCFGANGLVKRPDYSNTGVIDTFTKPITGSVPAISKEHNKKTCYNLHLYREKFWKSNHVPSVEANFCNTDFEKDVEKITYTNLYIRHYITKSWEEYVWKKKERGYFYGTRRTLDAFFIINRDMYPLRTTLKARAEDEILIVLPYCNMGQGNEITLALASWRKFCTFKYHFVVIGNFDEQLVKKFNWVEFIYEPCLPRVPGQYNPHLDIRHKMEIVYNKFKDRYSGFVYTCDDFYAIKPFTLVDIITIYYHQPSFTGVEALPTWNWKHDKWKTRQALDKRNLPHINYTTHFPWYFDFKTFKGFWVKYNMDKESYVLEDIYFNSFEHEPPVLDSTIRFGVWNKEIFENGFQKAIENPKIKFICNSVDGWSKELEEALQKIIV